MKIELDLYFNNNYNKIYEKVERFMLRQTSYRPETISFVDFPILKGHNSFLATIVKIKPKPIYDVQYYIIPM